MVFKKGKHKYIGKLSFFSSIFFQLVIFPISFKYILKEVILSFKLNHNLYCIFLNGYILLFNNSYNVCNIDKI